MRPPFTRLDPGPGTTPGMMQVIQDLYDKLSSMAASSSQPVSVPASVTNIYATGSGQGGSTSSATPAASIDGASGRAATPQYPFLPCLTALPSNNPSLGQPYAQDGMLIEISTATSKPGLLYRYSRPDLAWVGPIGFAVIVDTHANRATYPATNYPAGTCYWETDRRILYIVQDTGGTNHWWYALGTMLGISSDRPSDLTGSYDYGFKFKDLTTGRTQLWNNTMWVTQTELGVAYCGTHSERIARGRCNCTGGGSTTAVARTSGTSFSTSWIGRYLLIAALGETGSLRLYRISGVSGPDDLTIEGVTTEANSAFALWDSSTLAYPDGVHWWETDYEVEYTAADATGVVDTNGTAVSWQSEMKFDEAWRNQTIYINSVPYTIGGLVFDTAIALTGSAGVQTGVPYRVARGRWKPIAGEYLAPLASLPTDLISTDVGFPFTASDYLHTWIWNGTVWHLKPGCCSPGEVVASVDASAPRGGLWAACNGAAATISADDASTSSITTPNLTGDRFITAAYRTAQAATRATWESDAKTNVEAAHTHYVDGYTENASGITSTDAAAGAILDLTPQHSHQVQITSDAGSAHQHVLADATARLKLFDETNGGLPARIGLAFFVRR